jgi:hypothetical protein
LIASLTSQERIYPRGISSWVTLGGSDRTTSLAGWWRLFVSQPLFLTTLLAWVLRLGLWFRFLFGMAILDLRLIPSHPDRTGGLRFVSLSLRGLRWLGAALGAVVAGSVAEGFFFDHQPLESFQVMIVALIVIVLILVVGPLLVFFRPLIRARSTGILAYGSLGTAMGREFQSQWLSRKTSVNPETLARPDFSATIDLYSVVEGVYSMKAVPFDIRALIPLVYMTLFPFLPVLLAVMPLKEVLKYAAKLVL